MNDADPIVFDGVHRRFGEKSVLRGFDLRVRAGQIHALLGRNGSGKTTALRILLGFLAPHAGRAIVLGKDGLALTPAERGRIAYVSEDHRLLRHMSVAGVLAFEAGTRPGFDVATAQAAVRRCALDPKQRVGRLSRGQRAQLALIVALASRPDVLVFDDPALGLDVVMRRELLDVLIDLLADRGVPVLFSTHFLTDVERIADRVSILHEGRTLLDAPLDQIKQRICVCTWQGEGRPPAVDGLLRADRRASGWNLLLADLNDARTAALCATGGRLGPASVPSLDDLFLALTRGEGGRIVPARAGEVAA